MKIQLTLPEDSPANWPEFCTALHAAYTATLTEEQRKRPPISANVLVALGLVALAEKVAPDLVTPERLEEAAALALRRPGPQPKKRPETLPMFDERPGAWLSTIRLDSGTASVESDGKKLSLFGCHAISTAVAHAFEQGWGAIPETRDNLPGIRFIPPGASATVPAPEPMAAADVGVWVSESMVAAHHLILLADGRLVKQTEEENAAMHSGATKADDAIEIRRVDEVRTDSTDAACVLNCKRLTEEAKSRALDNAAIDAMRLGWTVKQEVRGGHAGLRFIPPHVNLTYEIAPGRRVTVAE